MEQLKQLVNEVLEKSYLLSLATLDQNGIWVADVIYVFDSEFNLYWLSQPTTRHSQAILKNPNVAASITLTEKPGEPDIGIQLEGKAQKIEGDILPIAIKHATKRNKPLPRKEGEIFEIGQSWYKITPTRIELIYKPLFGRTRQTLTL